jgi:hypothetical protein
LSNSSQLRVHYPHQRHIQLELLRSYFCRTNLALIYACPEVRSKIETIEPAARQLGWPAELLWNADFWDSPRGLAAVLEVQDEIIEVTSEFIAILKSRRDVLRFRREAS